MSEYFANTNNIDSEIKDSTQYILTYHAKLRMAQRNISLNDIRFVLRHGKLFHRAGAVFIHLRNKDIPIEMQRDSCVTRLVGTTVLLSCRCTITYSLVREKQSERERSTTILIPIVLTVWRNRQHGLHRIKRKPRGSNYPHIH